MCCISFVVSLFLSILNVTLVNSIILSQKRYNPCGLGVIHFDKISGNNNWKGFINHGLYPHFKEVQLNVLFVGPVVIDAKLPVPNQNIIQISVESEICQGICEHLRSSTLNITIKPGSEFEYYEFQIEVERNDFPFVSTVALNEEIICSDEIKLKYETHDHVCGRRSMRYTEMVTINTEVKPGDWPWHVAVFVLDPKMGQGRYSCAGNIISKTAVLTAAHCLYNTGNNKQIEPSEMMVIAGISNYTDETHGGRQRLVAMELISHPSYLGKLSTFDLGIIKVDRFEYTVYVQPICIWAPSQDKTILIGKEATTVGIGFTENGSQAESLNVSSTIVQKDSVCLDFAPLKDKDNIYSTLINNNTICTGPINKSQLRYDDNGSGLVFKALQKDHITSWMLRGVLSFCGGDSDESFCDPSMYYVYTDVGPHYEWINKTSMLEFHLKA